ncbi:MAG: hypothetical protein DI551_02235 [Micavibrio aeruginosavorus]|uniref:Uncharacterized protein n=1 Tax=Micavibrio aeruginosavorus TaxID=349221 RepID=A0A2W5NBC8_9BACT|nr:MAG: hypothetical protein DI551_02235 [Micavibrio aeruginosavorus]
MMGLANTFFKTTIGIGLGGCALNFIAVATHKPPKKELAVECRIENDDRKAFAFYSHAPYPQDAVPYFGRQVDSKAPESAVEACISTIGERNQSIGLHDVKVRYWVLFDGRDNFDKIPLGGIYVHRNEKNETEEGGRKLGNKLLQDQAIRSLRNDYARAKNQAKAISDSEWSLERASANLMTRGFNWAKGAMNVSF